MAEINPPYYGIFQKTKRAILIDEFPRSQGLFYMRSWRIDSFLGKNEP